MIIGMEQNAFFLNLYKKFTSGASYPLKIALSLPIRNDPLVSLFLEAIKVQIMFHYFLAKYLPRKGALLEVRRSFAKSSGHVR